VFLALLSHHCQVEVCVMYLHGTYMSRRRYHAAWACPWLYMPPTSQVWSTPYMESALIYFYTRYRSRIRPWDIVRPT